MVADTGVDAAVRRCSISIARKAGFASGRNGAGGGSTTTRALGAATVVMRCPLNTYDNVLYHTYHSNKESAFFQAAWCWGATDQKTRSSPASAAPWALHPYLLMPGRSSPRGLPLRRDDVAGCRRWFTTTWICWGKSQGTTPAALRRFSTSSRSRGASRRGRSRSSGAAFRPS
jgi:hypothetical protein